MSGLHDRLATALADAARRPGLHLGDMPPDDPLGDAADAAVLVAITDRARPGVLLTTRPQTMRQHAGQVAFPGGRSEPGDADLVATALREAREEIGLPPAQVRVVATMAPYMTITGFRVTPIVATVPPDITLTPDPSEVEDWFEPPLDYLLDPANQSRRSVLFQGRQRPYTEILWQGRRIWGATAAILANLGALIGSPV